MTRTIQTNKAKIALTQFVFMTKSVKIGLSAFHPDINTVKVLILLGINTLTSGLSAFHVIMVFLLPVWGVNKSESLCREQSLELITTNLMRDLPSYTNRATQRARRLTRRGDTFSYMLTAGRPEFKPLPLNPNVTSDDTAKTLSEGVEQIFFTTLERRYIAKQAIELQEFHWLLLTKTNTGWRKVMMFTQTGSFPVSKQVPSPPRDSSDGVVGQAVDAWLRDCQAGAIRGTTEKPVQSKKN